MANEAESFLDDWGEPYRDGILCSIDWSCPQCGVFKLFSHSLEEADQKIRFVIGFSKHVPSNLCKFDKAGGLIIQCPNCDCKFWLHIDRGLLAIYSELPSWRNNQS